MAIFRQGTSTTIGTKYSNPQPNSGGKDNLQSLIAQTNTSFLRARVLDIVLNNNHPKFKDVGEWNGIGVIYLELLDGKTTTKNIYAYPIFPQIKMYPLVNEIVLLASIPSKFIDSQQSPETVYYYFPSIGIWNHPHHNAYPLITSYIELEEAQRNDYDSINGTYVRRIDEDPTGINLNFTEYANPSQDTFVEKADVHPLLPFNGDVIYEGRWGNSLRFGSTTSTPPDSQLLINNNWSVIGSNGDPITILRNGQPINSTDEGWIPITENINQDLSSIYLTSYQKIPFAPASKEIYNSYPEGKKPILPSQYVHPQIIINSDRIIINAKTDSILMSSQQSISLSTIGSVNIDATSHYISSNDIKLGSKNATQPVLLGDNTVEILIQLTEAIRSLASILQVQRDYPGGVLATSYNAIAGNILNQINDPTNGVLVQLNNNSLKSQTTKVQ
jgi:hypothetical protein